jgi:uncharacterized protein (DUF1330 family)
MPTYIVGDIGITDPATYQTHVPRALATIARFGGRVIAGGGGRVDLLEGDPIPERIFIIEFPTADAARGWYRSDDYQEENSHRHRHMMEGGSCRFICHYCRARTSMAIVPPPGLRPGGWFRL